MRYEQSLKLPDKRRDLNGTCKNVRACLYVEGKTGGGVVAREPEGSGTFGICSAHSDAALPAAHMALVSVLMAPRPLAALSHEDTSPALGP